MRAEAGFESGFTGFSGLSITSLVWVGRLLLHIAFIVKLFADVLHIGEKKGIKYSSTNEHYTQTEDVLCNPVNPLNPDSKPSERL